MILLEIVELYVSQHLYSDFIALSAALLMKSTNDSDLYEMLEIILIQALLADDIYCGYLSLDIWLLFLRYDNITFM